MPRSRASHLIAALLAAAAASVHAEPAAGTAFTYQGKLVEAGVAANGAYDFAFTAFGQQAGGDPIAPTAFVEDVVVADGLFSTQVDLLSINYLDGVWIEIAVRPGASTDPHTPLDGRVYITPAPAAMWALNAGTVGGLAPGDLAPAAHTHAALHTPDGSLQVVTITPGGAIELPGAATLSGPADGAVRLGLAGATFSGVLEVFTDRYFDFYNRVGITTTNDTQVLHLHTPDVTDSLSTPSQVWVSTGSSLGTEDFNSAGDLALGTGKSEYGHGGNIFMFAGDGKSGAIGGGNGGDIRVEAGNGLGTSTSSRGGTVFINAGNTEEGEPGSIKVRAGGRSSDNQFGFVWLDGAYTWVSGRNGSGGNFPLILPPAALYVTNGDAVFDGDVTLWQDEPTLHAKDSMGVFGPGTLTVRGGDSAHFPHVDAGGMVLRGGSHTQTMGSGSGGEVTLAGGDGAVVGILPAHPGGHGGDVTIRGGVSNGNGAGNAPRLGGDVHIWGGDGASRGEDTRGHVFIQGLLAINRFDRPPEVDTVLQVGDDPLNGNGAHLTAGGMWTSTSDAATKEDFQPVDPRDVLGRVVAMPITNWRYKGGAGGARHIGPMAQDFHAAFGLGGSDRHIGMVDADGVALAAIQGLHAEIEERDARIAELEARLARLESLLVAAPE